jgi:hypothetical protein
MNVSQLKALLAKLPVPDETEIEVRLDLLDDEEPVIGNVKSISVALSVDKESVLVIDAVDAHPQEGEDGDEEE